MRWALALVAVALILFGLFGCWPPAIAQEGDHKEMYHADPHYDAWFRSLKMPGTNTSCCDLRDCSPADAEMRGDKWWAIVRGVWREIPPEKVVKAPLSIDGNAYVCAAPYDDAESATIFCFVPPIGLY